MPIDIITGLPGNGKTAIAVERMIAEAEKGERPVYAAGFDGLNVPGVTVLADPRTWNDTDERGDRVVSDGAVIYVDEAWKWFGHLHDASRGATPKHVIDLAEHRHRGLDFVWTTQQPNQIYPFSRGLVGAHQHVVRRYGTTFMDVFRWEELNEDVKSISRRESAEKTTRRLPEKVFDKYHSANAHTIKRRIPPRMIILPIALLGGIGALWFAINMLRPEKFAADHAGTAGPNAAQAASAQDATHVGTAKRYATADDYITLTKPRISAMPWTAPAYDGREVVAQPEVYCMASAGGLDGVGKTVAASCSCKTEQGTDYFIEETTCKRLARHGGAYNPFRAVAKEPNSLDKNGHVQAGETSPRSPESPRAVGTSADYQSPPDYGAMGVGASPR